MNNLAIFLEELNNVETLNQRLTIECENNSVSINSGEAIFKTTNKEFKTKSFNQFKTQINNFFNVQQK